MIQAIFLTAYLYLLLPLLIGVAVCLLFKKTLSASAVYMGGYISYLALFELIVLIETHRNVTYSEFSKDWWHITGIIAGITACVIIILLAKKKWSVASLTEVNKRENLLIICLSLLLTALAILILTPHSQDQTPELARLAISNDALLSIDPKTGTAYTDPASVPGFIFLFYTCGSTITGIDATTLIHLIMPVFLIPFFICTYVQIASILFPDTDPDIGKSCPESFSLTRFRFLYLIMLFYLLTLPFQVHIALTPYRNIWNGVTLAASCILPLLCVTLLGLLRDILERRTKDCRSSDAHIFSVLEPVSSLICLVLCAALCVPYTPALCALMILSAFLISIASLASFGRKRGDLS